MTTASITHPRVIWSMATPDPFPPEYTSTFHAGNVMYTLKVMDDHTAWVIRQEDGFAPQLTISRAFETVHEAKDWAEKEGIERVNSKHREAIERHPEHESHTCYVERITASPISRREHHMHETTHGMRSFPTYACQNHGVEICGYCYPQHKPEGACTERPAIKLGSPPYTITPLGYGNLQPNFGFRHAHQSDMGMGYYPAYLCGHGVEVCMFCVEWIHADIQ